MMEKIPYEAIMRPFNPDRVAVLANELNRAATFVREEIAS
jgi:hypothetical protein